MCFHGIQSGPHLSIAHLEDEIIASPSNDGENDAVCGTWPNLQLDVKVKVNIQIVH